MPIKKSSRVSATFNMSSLTDIIFLLLIFFMLTSSLVAPNALNLKLPGQPQPQVAKPDQQLDAVVISNDCTFSFNGETRSASKLETDLRRGKRADRGYAVTIAYRAKTSTECVVQVMDMARRLDVEGVLVAPKARG